MALPSRFNNNTQTTTNNNNKINTVYNKFALYETDDNIKKNANKANYTRMLANQERQKFSKGSLDELSVLSSNILMIAPPNFFDDIQKIALECTSTIQNNLSNSDKASLIAKLKNNPTDTELRQDAFLAINREFIRLDNFMASSNPIYQQFNELDKLFTLAMIVNEICGLGPLEPLYRDFSIREIICNGPFDVQVEIGGKLRRVESCKFTSAEHLQELISKLYNSVNKDVTRTNPFERARLHDNSRIFAVHTAIAPEGPNLNIRRHTSDWTSPEQLISWGACNEEILEWIGNKIIAGCSFIVNGGTGSGKTTLLAALTGFIPNDKRIVTIEKNIEIKPAKGKLLAAAMECIPRKNNSSGFEVTMRDLVECTTQQRPDFILCGEIVGEEAFDFLQAANTGHQVATTVHSNSSQDCIYRLMSLTTQAELVKGRAAYDLISAGIDFIVTVSRFPQDGSRKIVDVSEVGTQCLQGENGPYLPIYPIWQFQQNENINYGDKVTGKWVKVGQFSQERTQKHHLDLIPETPYEELNTMYER